MAVRMGIHGLLSFTVGAPGLRGRGGGRHAGLDRDAGVIVVPGVDRPNVVAVRCDHVVPAGAAPDHRLQHRTRLRLAYSCSGEFEWWVQL